IPEPSTLDAVANDPAMKGAVAFLVNIDIAEKAERFNITARRSQIDEIDRLARYRGMTRSAYMVASALSGKRSGELRELRGRRADSRPENRKRFRA
ncbi:MAG TPA: type II toxin-antitoxin system HicB family antitoxin, partial [Bryobacteraceae bacterium]|nr:type II toxin-antitoxin system HicB family antitoxin [Bryobacteraceae bacterium]